MPKCVSIRKKKQHVCIGDMRDRITVELRSLTPPAGSSVDFTESFSTKEEVWSLVETKEGEEFFDGTNVGVIITHWVFIRFLTGVTAEDWVLLENGERLDVLKVENLDIRGEFLKLVCTNRGTSANKASEA